MRPVIVVGSTLFAGALGGCFIFTGGTDGYEIVDGGQNEAAAATCAADAECVALTCVSASDCDSGEVCCLTATLSSLGSACQVGPCAEFQLCSANSECGDGGAACVSQQCSSSGVSLTLQSCSAIPGCTP